MPKGNTDDVAVRRCQVAKVAFEHRDVLPFLRTRAGRGSKFRKKSPAKQSDFAWAAVERRGMITASPWR